MATELDLAVPGWRASRIVSGTTCLAPPDSLTVVEQPAGLPEERHGWAALNCRELVNTTLDVDSGLAFSDGRVIAQSGSGTRASRDAAFVTGATVRVSSGPSTSIGHPIAPLGDVHHHYHFMIETLPRLIHARSVRPDVRFVTSVEIPIRYSTLLDELGFTVEVHPHGSLLVGEPLVLVDQPELFWPRPIDLEAVRATLGAAQAGTSPGDRLIYLPRTGVARSLVDEAWLEARLESRGFEVISTEGLTIREQVALFAEARVVVAPHGAALSNIAFASARASVIEISSGELFENCYRRMAACLGLDYQWVHVPGEPEAPFGRADDAWVRLEPVLDRLLP
jgi:hypothetical protein